MLHAGKKALGDLDAQLAALRKQCRSAAFPEPPNLVPVAGSSSQPLQQQPPSSHLTAASSILYEGALDPSIAAVSNSLHSSRIQQQRHLDPSEFQDALTYLKKAKRERLAEFEAMQEAFEYHEEDEDARVERSRQWAKHPLVTYEQPLQDPFVFVIGGGADEERVDWNATATHSDAVEKKRSSSSSRTTPIPKNTARAGSSSSQPPRTSSVGSRATAGSEFHALYDVDAALKSSTSTRQTSTAAHPRLDSQAGRLGTSAQSGKKEGSQVFASLIPSKPPIADTTSLRRAGADDLSSVGSVVPYSSVSVKAHINAGLRSQQRQVVSESRASSAHVSQVRHRPTCTVNVVHEGGIKFCSACGNCCVLAEDHQERKQQLCNRCGERLLKDVSAIAHTLPSSGEPSSGTSSDALRDIEEMERREAEAFRLAIEEWRSAAPAGTDGDESKGTVTSVTASASTPPPDNSKRTWQFPTLPMGPTYFSYLWEMMQQQEQVSASNVVV